jgi:hypothetical protein
MNEGTGTVKGLLRDVAARARGSFTIRDTEG